MNLYSTLEAAIADNVFPTVDVRLREGCHLCPDDRELFSFVTEAYPQLEVFYARYGYDLVRADAGYVFLKPHSSVRQSKLSIGCMLVGQALAVLLLDPAIFALDRRVSRSRVVDTLQQIVGEERLKKTLRVVKRTRNVAVEGQALRREVDASLRALDGLGFVRLLDDDTVELRTPLYRFVEAVKGATNESEALESLLSTTGEGSAPDEDDE